MSRQVDKKFTLLDEKLAKVLKHLNLKQVDFALKCLINPGTLSKALERSSFSEDIVDKIYDTYAVRKEYWEDGKEPIFEEKPTPAIKSDQPAISREERLIATLEKAVDSLGKQNLELIQIVKELTAKVPVSDRGQ